MLSKPSRSPRHRFANCVSPERRARDSLLRQSRDGLAAKDAYVDRAASGATEHGHAGFTLDG